MNSEYGGLRRRSQSAESQQFIAIDPDEDEMMTDESIKLPSVVPVPTLLLFRVGIFLSLLFGIVAFWNAMLNIFAPRYLPLHIAFGVAFSLLLLVLAPGAGRRKLKIVLRVCFGVFILASLGLWAMTFSTVRHNFSPMDLFKKNVNIVGSYDLPNGGEAVILDEVSLQFQYGRYLLYKKGDQESIFLIAHSADKFWPSQCRFVMQDDVLMVYQEKTLECAFSPEKMRLYRPEGSRAAGFTLAPVLDGFIFRKMADSPNQG